MPASWPVSLPQQLKLDGFQESLPDGRLRTPMDQGPGKTRRRSSALGRPETGSMVLTDAQLDTFLAFVSDDVAGGTLPFTMPAARGAGTSLVRLGDTMPAWAPAGSGLWTVSLALEVLP